MRPGERSLLSRRFFIPAFRVFLYHDSISPTSYAFLLFPLRPFIVIAMYFRLLTAARFYPSVFLSSSRFKHFLEKRYCLAIYCVVRNVDSSETRQNLLRIFYCPFFLIISITGHRKTILNSINFWIKVLDSLFKNNRHYCLCIHFNQDL